MDHETGALAKALFCYMGLGREGGGMNRRRGGREDGTMGGREERWEVSLSGSFDPGTSHLKVLVTYSPGHGESSMVPQRPTPPLREGQSPF